MSSDEPGSAPRAIAYVHWHAEEGQQRAAVLTGLGYKVTFCRPENAADLRALRDAPVSAYVIDLSRLPSHGRDVAVALRNWRASRSIPIVFAGGTPQKEARLRETLPDAHYSSWAGIGDSVSAALATPPQDLVVPGHNLAGYSGTPLPKKLGIAAGSRTAVLNAPADVAAILGPLPDGAVLEPAIGPGCDLALWFTSERTALEAEIARHAAAVPGRGLWILWPKKSSGVGSNLTEAIVRSCGLAAGLVDYKVCSVNEVWSGLRFTRRKP